MSVMSRLRSRKADGRLRHPSGARWLEVVGEDPCSYCGAPMETLDHITPRASGGKDRWENLAPACWRCNRDKSAHGLIEYLRRKQYESSIDDSRGGGAILDSGAE